MSNQRGGGGDGGPPGELSPTGVLLAKFFTKGLMMVAAVAITCVLAYNY